LHHGALSGEISLPQFRRRRFGGAISTSVKLPATMNSSVALILPRLMAEQKLKCATVSISQCLWTPDAVHLCGCYGIIKYIKSLAFLC
jgi:hypothetical protein